MRRGRMVPVIAAAMGAFAVFLHCVLLIQDQIMATPADARLLERLSLAERAVPLVQQTALSLTPLGWILVGVAGALAGGFTLASDQVTLTWAIPSLTGAGKKS
jgi:hypothetical protein